MMTGDNPEAGPAATPLTSPPSWGQGQPQNPPPNSSKSPETNPRAEAFCTDWKGGSNQQLREHTDEVPKSCVRRSRGALQRPPEPAQGERGPSPGRATK